MPPDLLAPLTPLAPLAQFGAAGLVAWMWLTERRSAAARERQLTEAHDRLAAQREHVSTLVALVAENTRALAALEASQRDLARVVERVGTLLDARDRTAALPGRAAG